jgi:hypothetical protein
MTGSGVIESRTAFQPEGQSPANHAHSPNQFIRHGPCPSDGHVILDFADAIGMEKSGDEDGGVGPIELFLPLGESKCGRQSQSIEPFSPTKAAVRKLPMTP